MRYDEYTLLDKYGKTVVKSYHSLLSPSKRDYVEHHHTECEISIFLSGSGTYTVNTEKYSFSEGAVFLFGSNEAHCITEIDESFDLLNIQFEPRLLWEDSEAYELISIFSSRSKSFKNKITERDPEISKLIFELEEELKCKLECRGVRVKYLLYSLIAQIIRSYDYVSTEKALGKAPVQSISRAIEYIEENLDTSLTLKSIAEVACMSPNYFSYLFKKLNGVSPWEYITIKRVEMAVRLLKTTTLTKLDIASACGFSSSSNFYKAFLKITGKTPTDYSG